MQRSKFRNSSYSASKQAARQFSSKRAEGGRLKVRLQKYLASCGVASRRAAEDLIVAKRVSVNGQVVSELGFQIRSDGRDRVLVDGKEVRPQELGILLLNKPKNVISTLDDPQGRPSVAQYLTKKYSSYFPVGRLDWESEGLVILTNDGELADLLLHPRYQIHREYSLQVEGYLHDKAIIRLKSGVNLEDGMAKALKVKLIDRDQEFSSLNIVVTEGRNRLVRRMLDAVGCPVLKLIRVGHGPFKLGNLKSGQVSRLTLKEYMDMKRTVQGYVNRIKESG